MDEKASVSVKTYLKCFRAKLVEFSHANHVLGSNRGHSLRLKTLHRSHHKAVGIAFLDVCALVLSFKRQTQRTVSL